MGRDKKKRLQADLLALAPPGTKRIKVRTELGVNKYRPMDEVAPSDVILTRADGNPIVMRTDPGRKTEIGLEPLTAEVAEIVRRKQEYLVQDDILQIVAADPESTDVLQQIMVGLGQEAASIGFERKEAERNGKETRLLSNSRVAVLRALGETWLKRKEQLTGKGVDLDSSAFRVLFQFIMETFRDSMTASKAPDEMIQTVFAKFGQMANGDDWSNEARSRMKKLA